jgi:hypothetical protein
MAAKTLSSGVARAFSISEKSKKSNSILGGGVEEEPREQ